MADVLDNQIKRMAFWSAVGMVITGLVSFALPLDAPHGVAAAERALWLSEHRGLFVLGWINQMAAMITLTLVLTALAWLVRTHNPLIAILGSATLFAAFIAFVIPKFIAIWTVPLLAQEATGGGVQSALSSQLLELLHITLPYSLFTSFDYLGFWLYAVFGLLIAGTLFRGSIASKVTALALGAYGVAYHLVMIGIITGRVAAASIEGYALGVTFLLIIAVLGSLPLFRVSASAVVEPQAS